MSNLYIIQEFPSRLIKIGKSNNPKKRLQMLRTGNPYLLELVGYVEFNSDTDARKAEIKLHKIYSKYNKRNEWFNLPKQGQELLEEVCLLTNGNKIQYITQTFIHITDTSLFYTVGPIKSVKRYKKLIRAYKDLYNYVEQNNPAELEYIKTFKPKLWLAGISMKSRKEKLSQSPSLEQVLKERQKLKGNSNRIVLEI